MKSKSNKTYKKRITTNNPQSKVKTQSNKKSAQSSTRQYKSNVKSQVTNSSITKTSSSQRASFNYKEKYSTSSKTSQINSTINKQVSITSTSRKSNESKNIRNSQIKTANIKVQRKSNEIKNTSASQIKTIRANDIKNTARSMIQTQTSQIKTANIKAQNIRAISNISDNVSKIKTIRANDIRNTTGNVIQTQLSGNRQKLNIRRLTIKPLQKSKKLRAGRVGVFDPLRSDDGTTNIATGAIYNGGIYTKKTVNTAKSITKGTVKTVKGIRRIAITSAMIYRGKQKIEFAKLGKIALKGSLKSVKKVSGGTIRTAHSMLKGNDNTTDITANALYHNIEYARRGINAAKKTINTGKSINNARKVIKRRLNKIYRLKRNRVGILTQKRGLLGINKTKIFTKAKMRRIGKRNLYNNKIKTRLLKKAQKIYFKAMNDMKKLLQAIMRNPKVVAITVACAVGIMFLMSVIGGFTGTANASATVVPNIKDPNAWIQKMNQIDASTTRIIDSADEFKVVNRNVKASWKDVIAVYMAKYYNDPPDLDSTSSGGSGGSSTGGVTAGGSSSETTFSGKYADLIKLAADKYNVDPNLIAAVIKQESNFNPNDVSEAGAMGLMQLMPENLPSCGVTDAFDPVQNVMGGTKMLHELCERYNNDLTMVLIAYNYGEGNMEKHGIFSDDDLDKCPAETRAYVPIVIGNYNAYKNGTPLPDSTVTGSLSGDVSSTNGELGQIYHLFNTISVTTRTETETHDDGSTSTKTIKVVTLTRHDIDYVMKELKFNKDQIEMAKTMLQADAFKDVIPNFDFRFKIPGCSGSDVGSGSGDSSGDGKIGSHATGNGQALSDSEFATLKGYIDRCLGIPYQMGGDDPASGVLDCSGFVSWVYRQTGVLNQRYTAQGLCDISTPVDEKDLKPGDLIFFQDTYKCGDTVTHVGIYVGNGMMAHSGNPCQIASYETSYWQEHFYGYGRLT